MQAATRHKELVGHAIPIDIATPIRRVPTSEAYHRSKRFLGSHDGIPTMFLCHANSVMTYACVIQNFRVESDVDSMKIRKPKPDYYVRGVPLRGRAQDGTT